MAKLYVLGNMALDVIADRNSIRPDDVIYEHEGTGRVYKAGGGGPYSFFAALASGAKAELLTSGTSDHPLIRNMMERSGAPIYPLNDNTQIVEQENGDRFITPFPDFMPEFDGGHRTLYSHQDGYQITPEAIVAAGVTFEEGSTFLVAPVKGEATLDLIRYLRERGQVIGTIQGWMRVTNTEVNMDGKKLEVSAKTITQDFEEALKLHNLVIFSDEDERGLSEEDQQKLRELPGMAIRTEGDNGCKIYTKELVEGKMQLVERHYPAYSLTYELREKLKEDTLEAKSLRERAFTGCGDATGATYAHNFLMNIPPEMAYRDTALTIALKISEVMQGGRGGIEGTPAVDEIIGHVLSEEGQTRYEAYNEAIMEAHNNPSIYNTQSRK